MKKKTTKQTNNTYSDWDDVLQNILEDAQTREKKSTGTSDDWSNVLENAATEARKRKNNDARINNNTDTRTGIDQTIYDTDIPTDNRTVIDETIYDTDIPTDNRTVIDETIYDTVIPTDNRTVIDETIYDTSIPTENSTVIDKTFYDTDILNKNGITSDSTVLESESSESFVRGKTILSTYRIDSDPILGGMGSVWKVHHIGWNVDLAVKQPKAGIFKSEKQKSDFIEECKSWINLGIHPNIVACYYVREINGVLSIFSEWMNNGSLEDRIHDKSVYRGSENIVQERLLDISIQFAEGLYCSHNAGLIHRDVKPANVLLTRDWDARVADFGIAQFASGSKKDNVLTPAYCSPEQAAGKKLSRRTDIYSWAVSILELYLGYKPWAHQGMLSGPLAGKACRDYFEMCKDHPIPDALQTLLEKCMKSDLRNRPLNFATVIKELKNIYKRETGRAYPRPVSKVSPESADNLNNRALSYLDLGYNDETDKLWKKAALLEPAHTETLFNRCLYGYRSGSMTLYEAQCFLSANWENHFNQAEPGFLLAELSLEGNDRVTVKDVLSYIRNYSTQQEELSKEKTEKLNILESKANSGTWYCTYRLSQVKNFKEQELLQKKRNEKLTEIKSFVRKNMWDEACTQFLISHFDPSLGDVIYQHDWMDFYEELSRKCMPVLVLAQWPVMTVSNTRLHDKVSFSADSRYMLCGDRLYDLKTGEQIADNRDGLNELDVCLSDLSPDGSFYLRAPVGGYNFMKVDARTGETLEVIRGHEKSITALAISRDGKHLASGDKGGTFKYWDENGNLIKSEQYSDDELEDIQFGYDSRQRVLRYENALYLTDEINNSVKSIRYDNYLEVAVNLNYTALGMAVGRRGLHYYDIKTNEDRIMDDQEAAIRRGRGITTASQVCFMHNQNYLLASSGDLLFFFDPYNKKILSAIHMGHNFCSIAVSRNGKFIAAISDGKAQLWRCIYGFRYINPYQEHGYIDDDSNPVKACAHIQCSAHPDKNIDELVIPLMEELADRGYGAVEKEVALSALRAARS